MKDSDKASGQDHKRKKHGDFSKFIKKKHTSSKKIKSNKPSVRKSKSEITKERQFGKTDKKDTRILKYKQKGRRSTKSSNYLTEGGLIRLNKFIANAGICSRREADNLITSGAVSVNGKVVTELGTKISPTDKVKYGGETLHSEKLQYVLLNKPKGFITTTDDPYERKTVMTLIQNACKERIYPVGRLDRNTTGLLLFTNDGKLAKRLTHPSYQIKKIYHIYLNKSLAKNDMITIANGIELDDGFIRPDKISWVGDGKDKHEIGIEIHSGRNRIVRRIFETLNYKVVKLDRVFFCGLTKKDIPRGKWRLLKNDEINFLKML